MWIWTVLFSLTVLTANCASKYPQTQTLNQAPVRTQRIIKVHGPPQLNHFHGHHKHIRNRPPYSGIQKEEFVRPSLPQSRPPFFDGPSTNHIKHLPRPPPHVFHKLQSYGVGFPYKSVTSFRTTLTKPPIRKPQLGSVRPTTAVQLPQVTPIPKAVTKATAASASYYSPAFTASSYVSSPVRHIITSDGNDGPIREIPAPNLGPKPSGSLSVSGITHPEPDPYGSFKGSSADASLILKESGLGLSSYIKESSAEPSYTKDSTLEIPDFDQGTSLDVTNLVKGAVESEKHSPNYEVTELHNNIPLNDQIIKSHDGTKLYYAPDPDPSLPVHKVPPTKDPHSTPSHGSNFNGVYLPQISHGISYLQSGSIGAPVATLSSQELYSLMNGYPTVLSHPLVAFVSQPQPNGVIVPDPSQNYYSQSPQGASGPSESEDITQYLQNPQIYNLLHNTPESHPKQEPLQVSQSTVVNHKNHQQSPYSAEDQYRSYIQTNYRPYYYANANSLSGSDASEGNHNHQYEPEASESRNSLTVIRQTKEGTTGSVTVKDLPLDDSTSNDLNSDEEEQDSQVYELKNLPEVPFYSTLPSKQAAETLAGLQAAGSIASTYMNKIKNVRTHQEIDEAEEKDEKLEGMRGKTGERLEVLQLSGFQKLDEEGTEQTNTSVIDENSAFYESATHPEDVSTEDAPNSSEDLSNLDFKNDDTNETFGKRLRPK